MSMSSSSVRTASRCGASCVEDSPPSLSCPRGRRAGSRPSPSPEGSRPLSQDGSLLPSPPLFQTVSPSSIPSAAGRSVRMRCFPHDSGGQKGFCTLSRSPCREGNPSSPSARGHREAPRSSYSAAHRRCRTCRGSHSDGPWDPSYLRDSLRRCQDPPERAVRAPLRRLRSHGNPAKAHGRSPPHAFPRPPQAASPPVYPP